MFYLIDCLNDWTVSNFDASHERQQKICKINQLQSQPVFVRPLSGDRLFSQFKLRCSSFSIIYADALIFKPNDNFI